MRYLVLMAMLLSPATSRALDLTWEWTTRDTVMEAAFVGLTFLDWQQTRWGLYSPEAVEYGAARGIGFYETNPFLGRHPSQTKFDLMVGGAVLGHVVVARLLPSPFRFVWQATFVVVEANAIATNASLVGGGLRFYF